MYWNVIRGNSSRVPNYLRVNPIIVNVAVEYFAPAAAGRKTDAIAVAVEVGHAYYNNYVVPFAWYPPVERQDTIRRTNR